MWAPNLLTVRQRSSKAVLGIESDLRQTCPGCGATIPLNMGAVTACPFCSGNLIGAEKSRRQVQKEAAAAVAREQQQSKTAAAVAEKTGAQMVQDVLRIPRMISLPVVFVALPVALGQLAAHLAFRYVLPADLVSRNLKDIICVSVGGVFILVTVISAFAIVVRMDKRRKNIAGSISPGSGKRNLAKTRTP